MRSQVPRRAGLLAEGRHGHPHLRDRHRLGFKSAEPTATASPTLESTATANVALVRKLALNLPRLEPTRATGVKASRLRAGWDNAFLLHVLGVHKDAISLPIIHRISSQH